MRTVFTVDDDDDCCSHRVLKAELEMGHGSLGQPFGWVKSGHGSVCHTWCWTNFTFVTRLSLYW